jgi:hypothetical protein
MPFKEIFSSLKDRFASYKDDIADGSKERLSRTDRSNPGDSSIAKNNPFFGNGQEPAASQSQPQPQESRMSDSKTPPASNHLLASAPAADAPPPAYSPIASKDGSSRRSVSSSRAGITS